MEREIYTGFDDFKRTIKNTLLLAAMTRRSGVIKTVFITGG
jgi:hypothetical protein